MTPRRAAPRLAARSEPIGPLDPAPTGRARDRRAAPAEPLRGDAVAAAVERITAGELEKVVLAREVTVGRRPAHDPGPILGALRELFPSCFCFCVGTPEAAFIGASPELLIRRRGAVAATVALAGLHPAQRRPRRRRPPRRADAPQRQGARGARDRRAAGSSARCGRTRSGSRPRTSPSLARIANIQHLATPIRAQLADSRSAIDAGRACCIRRPAVGGRAARAGRSS